METKKKDYTIFVEELSQKESRLSSIFIYWVQGLSNLYLLKMLSNYIDESLYSKLQNMHEKEHGKNWNSLIKKHLQEKGITYEDLEREAGQKFDAFYKYQISRRNDILKGKS